MILDGFKMLCNRSHPTFSSIDITLARLACREHSAFSCEVEMHLTWRTLTYPTVSSSAPQAKAWGQYLLREILWTTPSKYPSSIAHGKEAYSWGKTVALRICTCDGIAASGSCLCFLLHTIFFLVWFCAWNKSSLGWEVISLDAAKNENNMLDSFSSRSALQLDQQRGDVWTTNSALETPSVYCRGCGSAVGH